MSRRPLISILALICSAVAGCTGGGGGVTCSFDSPATLAPSAWPKFRHDAQNTGTVTNTLVAANSGQLLWMFPPASEPPKGPFAASPVLNGTATDPTSATRVYIGSTDNYLYAVKIADGTQDPTFYFVTQNPITSTALVAQRFGADALFFGDGNGDLFGVDASGNAQPTNWPTLVTGFISSSPTLTTVDGTVYTASLGGIIAGVCPNGVERFALSTAGNQSSPAADVSSILYYGGDDHLLRAVRNDGALLWSFSASAPILNAPVVAITNGSTAAIYVADNGGFIFKVNSNGQAIPGFTFSGPGGGPVGPMQSSPALAGDRLYVGSDDGNLYAVDATSGTVVWSFPTNGPIISSPAVAIGGEEPVIVVGSTDGNVYFVRDAGASATLMTTFAIGAPVRSSPALGADGTVYVGADDGRLYAIH
ncbi:MAG TPA: PQQ-binding-like beta-propeller repeat protein [Candidatus Margulisiibacteriota bacterium]|nr:PQQ-binding-like beta-propeller repeat protein [Candidatus Margulisiibacteriota bacterium]